MLPAPVGILLYVVTTTIGSRRFTPPTSAPTVATPEKNVTVDVRAASVPALGSAARACMSLGSARGPEEAKQ